MTSFQRNYNNNDNNKVTFTKRGPIHNGSPQLAAQLDLARAPTLQHRTYTRHDWTLHTNNSQRQGREKQHFGKIDTNASK